MNNRVKIYVSMVLVLIFSLVSGSVLVYADTSDEVIIRAVWFQSDPDIVTFADLNLDRVIRKTLNKPTGDITAGELATLSKLDGSLNQHQRQT